MRRVPAVLGVLVLAAAAGAEPPGESAAGDPPVPDEKFWQRDDRWTVRFEPAAWYAGLSGYVTLPQEPTTAGPSPETILGELNQDTGSRVTPFGEVNLRKGDWGISLRGFAFSSFHTATLDYDWQIGDLPISDGDTISSEVEIINFDADVRYRVLPGPEGRVQPGRYRARPRLEVLAGARFFDTSWTVTNPSLVVIPEDPMNSDSADEAFFHVVAGVKASLEMHDRFTIDAQLTAGGLPLGDQSSYSFDVLVGGTWKPWPNVGVQVGYRALFFWLQSGDGDGQYDFHGTLQGLYFGVVAEF
jgi:hypothetical protein